MHGEQQCLFNLSGETCKAKVIRAHSISRSAALSKLARANRVYAPFADPFAIEKNNGEMPHTLQEIKASNTFTGFCSLHDDQLFRRVDRTFERPDLEQVFLLHYRALCRELYTKKAAYLATELLRDVDRGKDEHTQRTVQKLVYSYQNASKKALLELENDKVACDSMLSYSSFGRMRAFVVQFSSLPTIVCSGFTHPASDFSGNLLQNLGDLNAILSRVSLSLLPTDVGGFAVLAWLQESDSVVRRLAESLNAVADSLKSSAVAQWVFDSFENRAIEPTWWEGLTSQTRNQIQELSGHWTSASPISSKWLVPSTHKLVDWNFAASYWF